MVDFPGFAPNRIISRVAMQLSLARRSAPVHRASMQMPPVTPPSPQAAVAPPITVDRAADGSVIYLIDLPPEAMPAVRVRDLRSAWEAAHDAACARAWGVTRFLRFHRGDGRFTDLALADRDARCWAGAIDRVAGLNTSYGLSLCLRLLALIDLLARAAWTAPLVVVQPAKTELHPDLLRLAANATLTEEARFDEKRIQDGLGHVAGRAVSMTGACA